MNECELKGKRMTVAEELKDQSNSQREPGRVSKDRQGNKAEKTGVVQSKLGSSCKCMGFHTKSMEPGASYSRGQGKSCHAVGQMILYFVCISKDSGK